MSALNESCNVGMVLSGGSFPPDIRVEKEARSLIEAGYRVHLLCLLAGDVQMAQETVGGIQVHRIQNPDPLGSMREKVRYYLTGVHDNWLRAILAFATDQDIDVLHIHDLPHALTAAAAARARGIPLVFDMHGDLPAALDIHHAANPDTARQSFSIKRAPLGLLLGTGTTWLRRMEKRAFEQADHIIVVVDESKERLVNLGVPPEKVTVVLNSEDVDYFTDLPIDRKVTEGFQGKFVVSYIGGMEAVRGLDILIESFPEVLAQVPAATLLLVGDGYMRSRLEELAGNLGIQNNVVFTGWVDFSLIPTYISISDVCMVPHTNNALTDTTIPHKLFQYMLMGKPVVGLPVRPIKRIIDETGAGVVAPDETPEAMAAAILQVAEPDRAKLMGENGRRAALGAYSWANDAHRLVELYNGLALHGPERRLSGTLR